MTTIAILPENVGANETTYRAVAGERVSVGKTAGEALDALVKQLNGEEANMLVVVNQLRPDRFFTAQQQQRLAELMSHWRTAREADSDLPADEQAELEALIEAELQAAAGRAEAVLRELNR